ncbi:hypothetical protein ACCS96_29415, partial [Rhizobium ruizarguesonis]
MKKPLQCRAERATTSPDRVTLAASPPLRHLCSDRNKAFVAIGETIVVKTRGADMDHVDIILMTNARIDEAVEN